MRMYEGNGGKLCVAHSFHTVVFHSTHKVIIAQKISRLFNPTLRLQQTEISTSPSYFRVLYPSPFASVSKRVFKRSHSYDANHTRAFSYERVCTRTRFQTEAQVYSEMDYVIIIKTLHSARTVQPKTYVDFTAGIWRFHNFNENFSWSSNKLFELAREHIAGDCLRKKVLKQKNKIFIYLALLQYKPNMKREAKLVLSPDTWPSPRFHDSGCLAAPRFLKMTGVTWQAEKRLIGW